VAGEFTLATPITIVEPFITIDGSGAPLPGVTLRGEGLYIQTYEVLVRHLRVRIGDEGEDTATRDGISISTTGGATDIYNVVIDHCSLSWGIDSNGSTWVYTGPHKLYNVTISDCIFSEGLYNSIHVDEGEPPGTYDPHSMGWIVGSRPTATQPHQHVTFLRNLMSHNGDRNPLIAGATEVEVINNIVYNWKSVPTSIGGSGRLSVVHILGNYYKKGIDSNDRSIYIDPNTSPSTRIYQSGNIHTADGTTLIAPIIINTFGFVFDTAPIFTPSNTATMTYADAYAYVLENAGATLPARDAIDARIVDDVTNRTGALMKSVDG
jgi:hypothetical protein